MKIGDIKIIVRFYPFFTGPSNDLRRGFQRVVLELQKVRCYEGMRLDWKPIGWADSYVAPHDINSR